LYVAMNREYNCKVSSKNSKRLLENLQNTTGDYFFCRTQCFAYEDWGVVDVNMIIVIYY